MIYRLSIRCVYIRSIKFPVGRHNGTIAVVLDGKGFTCVAKVFGGAGSVSNVHNTKRIMISLPDYLLQEVDGIVKKENSNRSEFIRQAMKVYLTERKKRFLRDSMQRGYMEMAKINLTIASEAFQAEEDAGSTLDRLVSGV